ncbi:HlyD family efflux transporter periplasmic adaptor subunit [Kitasatospora cinereorecta]|uniref:HlyD family efflux transporter periplasmic adaptor subunit n=1 Tax=Kitasatospora cinereorecta TaxID=285560 RepID=A0ABW0V9H8_9ACTN
MGAPFGGLGGPRGAWLLLGSILCLFATTTGYLLVASAAAPATGRKAERANVSRTVRLTGTVVPTARFWLFFGRSAAAGDPQSGTEDPCAWFTSSPDPATGLGRVTSVAVAVGTHVTAGAVLAEADTAAAQQQADLAAAELTAAQSALARDRKLVALLDAEAPAPPPPLAPAATRAATPTTPAASSPSSVATPTPGSRAAERLAATAQIATDEQRVATAQNRVNALAATIANAAVKAPVDGIVEQVGTPVGATPSCRFPVVVLRSDTVQVEAFAAPEDSADLQAGQPATVSASGGTSVAATALSAVPSPCPPAPQGRQVNVATPCGLRPWLLPLPGGTQAAPGTAVTVTVTTQQHGGVLAVPNAAVRHRKSGEPYVVTGRCDTEGRRCREGNSRTVTLGMVGDALTEITAGVEEDTVVIVPAK